MLSKTLFQTGSGLARSAAAFSTSTTKQQQQKYDALVVGGGHNGLVAAAYLSKSGLRRVRVLERRPVLGGAAVTEEIVPGYKFSRASYLLSLLRPAVMDELELKKHGLRVYLRDPSSFTPVLGSEKSLLLGMSAEENRRQIAQFSEKDSRVFEEYEEKLNTFVDLLDPILDLSPSELARIFGQGTSLRERIRRLREVRGPLRKAARAAKEADLAALYELVTAPSEKVKKYCIIIAAAAAAAVVAAAAVATVLTFNKKNYFSGPEQDL